MARADRGRSELQLTPGRLQGGGPFFGTIQTNCVLFQ